MDLQSFFKQQSLQWHNEPAEWGVENGQLKIVTDAETDFWQRTNYGFRADNGHLLYAEIRGDFVMEARIICSHKHQYDQAGLMVHVAEDCWVKTSVEYEPAEPNKLGAVVTNHGYSDWSTQDVADSLTDYRLRIRRKGSDYRIDHYHEASGEWVQLRVFHLFDEATVKAGVYACSPKGGGFEAVFEYLKILPGRETNSLNRFNYSI